MIQVLRVVHGSFVPFSCVSDVVGAKPGSGGSLASYASRTEMSFAVASWEEMRLGVGKRRGAGASSATVDNRASTASTCRGGVMP